MTFNVGIFVAVVVGESIGFLFFSSGWIIPSSGFAPVARAACH
jgi:ABC-type transport system involved in cytochrome bd biosynthesis fused ATPase/permease subunit